MPTTHTATHFPPDILQRAQAVRVVFFDIDGVFTDGGIYYSEAGETLKRFHTLDGYGIKLLRHIGVEPVVISGRDSAALRQRLATLRIQHMTLGTEDKLPAAEKWLNTLALTWAQAAAIGDDWPDLPVLKRSALAAAPPQAHIEVRTIAHYTTHAASGCGAVRELCDMVLHAQGHYADLLHQQLT